MTGRCRDLSGFTLIELAVVLTIIAITAGIASMGVVSLIGNGKDRGVEAIDALRSKAIRQGQPITWEDTVGKRVVRFLPDGRAIGIGVNAITGRPSPTGPQNR